MKRLIVCCDGTLNRLGAAVPTNVVKLASGIAPVDAQGTPQIVFYDKGVGTDTQLFHGVRKWLEGAFGLGLDQYLEEAYRFLCMNYVPGDEIYIFGFSRGAFTARSLCGLIRKCGILRREKIREAPKAVDYYRNHERASSENSQNFRLAHSRGKVGAEDVIASVRGELHEAGVVAGERIEDAAKLALAADAEAVNITYVGIWETVGSLGLPDKIWFSRYINRRYRFHDTELTSLVASARHAVAIDEMRESFSVVPWRNLKELNELRGPLKRDGKELERYRQCWFPGDHGCVGGGTAETEPLATIALQWVADGASSMGLEFEGRFVNQWAHSADCEIAFEEPANLITKLRRMLLNLPGVGPRKFVGGIEDVADAAVLRWNRLESYRPQTLRGVHDKMKPALSERGLPENCDPQ